MVKTYKVQSLGHNPYFNRWFSAIVLGYESELQDERSQSLF